jgi:hypothetical protein
MIETQCLCGAVKVRLHGPPLMQLYCHCVDCQRAQSGAYAPAAIYKAEAVEVVQGELRPLVIQTLPRMRCRECGTHVFNEIARVGLRSFNAYLLPDGVFAPQFHICCADAVLPVVDNLPHYRGLPSAFGGEETFVDW